MHPVIRSCVGSQHINALHRTASEHHLPCTQQIFTPRELSQLDVYGTWAVIRNRLHTDDSFEFNKTLKGIKESILHLPDATEQDEQALQAVKVRNMITCVMNVYICSWLDEHISVCYLTPSPQQNWYVCWGHSNLVW